MAQRAATKKFLPGVYELPGGHIDYGEDIVVGLKREIMEEFGMAITVGDPFAVFTYINDVKGSHSIEVIYFAKFVEDLAAIKLDPEDHAACDWFAKNELDPVISSGKTLDNPEMQAIQKGFALLHGEQLVY